MVLLLVRKSEISHVLAEHLYAVSVFASRRCASDLFDTRYHAKRNFHNVRCVTVRRTKIQLVIRDAENATGGTAVRAQVRYFPGDTLDLLAGQQRWIIRARFNTLIRCNLFNTKISQIIYYT